MQEDVENGRERGRDTRDTLLTCIQDVISFSIRPPKCNRGKFPRLKATLYRPSGYSEFLYRADIEIEISENKVTGLPRALFVRLLPRFATCDRCAHLYLDYEKIVYRNLWTDYRGKSVGKDICRIFVNKKMVCCNL